MNKTERQLSDEEKNEEVSNSKIGVGILLKEGREKKGLGYDEVSEITRIRPYILEALENEEWDRVPSLVLVTGFIRSYARAIGLEEDEVITLYQEMVPPESSSLNVLEKAAKSRWKFPVILISFLLIVCICAFYLWKENTSDRVPSASEETVNLPQDEIAEPEGAQEVTEEIESPSAQDQQDEKALTLEAVPEAVEVETGDDSPAEEEESRIDMENPSIVPESDTTDSPVVNDETASRELVLEAGISETTWVRILVDSQEPREYLFQAGDRTEWKAEYCLELIIGNAGGIELMFNGAKIENLGEPGQVVHLKLP
ncbi:MAG: DUF4115 domain-containing protein [Desulfobacterales bacterium]|nr:DUF4115 domain-containing protein [Desulfobacterales bacterium]